MKQYEIIRYSGDPEAPDEQLIIWAHDAWDALQIGDIPWHPVYSVRALGDEKPVYELKRELLK